MRSTRTVLVIVGLILVAGVVLGSTADTADSYGWFAYAPEEGESVAFDGAYLLTTRQVVGWVVAWLASLVVTGVIVRHLALRRRTRTDDVPE